MESRATTSAASLLSRAELEALPKVLISLQEIHRQFQRIVADASASKDCFSEMPHEDIRAIVLLATLGGILLGAHHEVAAGSMPDEEVAS